MVKSKILKFKKLQTLFKPGDVLVYGLIILIMAAGFLNVRVLMGRGQERLAIVEMDAKVIYTVNLKQNMETQKIRVDAGQGRYNTILVDYDYVEVLESNCPDQVCVGWGRIRFAGQTIVCLPFRIVVRITGRIGQDIIDDITW